MTKIIYIYIYFFFNCIFKPSLSLRILFLGSPQGEAFAFSCSSKPLPQKNSIFPLLSQSLFQPGNRLVALGTHTLLKPTLAKVTNEKLLNSRATVLSLCPWSLAGAVLPSACFLRKRLILICLPALWPGCLDGLCGFHLLWTPPPSTAWAPAIVYLLMAAKSLVFHADLSLQYLLVQRLGFSPNSTTYLRPFI